MIKYSISNNTYNLTVSDHGAEITSLIKDGRELMWQADPAFWGRTSPVLFPLVGNYWEKKSRFAGQTYEMGQHGFARDMDFLLVSETDDELVLSLGTMKPHMKNIRFRLCFALDTSLMLTE